MTNDKQEELDIKLLEAVRNKDLAAVKDLVEQGADINYVNDKGWSPIIEASLFGNDSDITHLLLKKGVSIELTKLIECNGRTLEVFGGGSLTGCIKSENLIDFTTRFGSSTKPTFAQHKFIGLAYAIDSMFKAKYTSFIYKHCASIQKPLSEEQLAEVGKHCALLDSDSQASFSYSDLTNTNKFLGGTFTLNTPRTIEPIKYYNFNVINFCAGRIISLFLQKSPDERVAAKEILEQRLQEISIKPKDPNDLTSKILSSALSFIKIKESANLIKNKPSAINEEKGLDEHLTTEQIDLFLKNTDIVHDLFKGEPLEEKIFLQDLIAYRNHNFSTLTRIAKEMPYLPKDAWGEVFKHLEFSYTLGDSPNEPEAH